MCFLIFKLCIFILSFIYFFITKNLRPFSSIDDIPNENIETNVHDEQYQRSVIPESIESQFTTILINNRNSLREKSLEFQDAQLALAKFYIQNKLSKIEDSNADFQMRYHEEQERYKRERHKYLVEEARKKKELVRKEAEYMAFVAVEEELRFKRLQAGRSLQDKALEAEKLRLLEEAEKEKARINAIRAEAAAATAAKRQKEMEEKERQNELDSLFAMRKEETRCIEVENFTKERERYQTFFFKYKI